MDKKIDINTLVDIRDVSINPKQSKDERIKNFVTQIKNPLCYRCGDYIVEVEFSEDSGRTMEGCFKEYLKTFWIFSNITKWFIGIDKIKDLYYNVYVRMNWIKLCSESLSYNWVYKSDYLVRRFFYAQNIEDKV